MAKNIWNKDIEKEIVDIFQHLIKIKTINSHKNEIEAAKFINDLLKKEGIKSTIIEPSKGRGNIIAKIKGGEGTPIIFLSHLDVVDVVEEKWLYDPFEAINDNGVIYGRGTLDTKHLTVMGLASLILLKRNNINLNRDIIFIATADEENGSKYGMKYLTDNLSHLIPKGYVINEGGGFVLNICDKLFRTCACGEKGICDVKVVIEPNNNENIYNTQRAMMLSLSKIIQRVASYESEEIICSISRRFKELADKHIHKDETLRNLWEYMVHNTVTVNEFNINKFNKSIEIMIKIRFVPGVVREDIISLIESLLEGECLQWEIVNYIDSYESSIDNEFIELLASKSNEYGKKTIMLPVIALGNTDGRFIKHNVYGYSPLLDDIPFKQVLEKVHSHNEYITIDSLIYGSRVLFDVVMEMLKQGGI